MGSAHTYSGAAKWSRRRGYGLRKLFSLSWILTGKPTYWHGYGLRKLFSLSWILTGKPTYGLETTGSWIKTDFQINLITV